MSRPPPQQGHDGARADKPETDPEWRNGICRLIHDIPVIHRRNGPDSPWRESESWGSVGLRDEERTSRKGRKFQTAATAEAGSVFRDAGHRSSGAGSRRRSVRRKPIPLSSKVQRNRRLRPKEPRKGTDRGRKTSAGTRQGPRRSLLRRDKPDPPGKDAKPSPARQFGPGTSGGWWRHQLPFCIWGPLFFRRPAGPRSRGLFFVRPPESGRLESVVGRSLQPGGETFFARRRAGSAIPVRHPDEGQDPGTRNMRTRALPLFIDPG